jgi:uncharacterized protein YjbI with pentapeptide repeats
MRPWARWVPVALGAFIGLWLIWVGIPQLTVPNASEADLRDVPAETKWQARDNRRQLQNDARTTLLQGLGGLAVLAGALFTYRQVQTNRHQLEIARQGQVTERFTRAIDQLGNENEHVRLGGIYALERIANDSAQDRATITEILTAFVRGHAPWPPSRPGQPHEDTPVEDIPPLRSWAPDVQAALTVLGRRKLPVGPPEPVNLADVDLRGASFYRSDLRGAAFFRSRLQAANFSDAQLQDAIFLDAVLHRAGFSGAQLQQASFTDAELQGAWFHEANLQGAQPLRAQLQGAALSKAQLQKAILDEAQLQNADLNHAELQGAWLGGAQLQGADLTDAQLQGAQCNAETVWPDGFDWKAAGVQFGPFSTWGM